MTLQLLDFWNLLPHLMTLFSLSVLSLVPSFLCPCYLPFYRYPLTLSLFHSICDYVCACVCVCVRARARGCVCVIPSLASAWEVKCWNLLLRDTLSLAARCTFPLIRHVPSPSPHPICWLKLKILKVHIF